MKLVKNIREIAKNVLTSEAEALQKVSERIDGQFEAAVKTIFESTGRVAITGIGKSAIIANKIVATLNSTGTPAVFMHGADAIHGDLGIIQPQDVVICLSKSGDTPEIKVLTPLLKRRCLKLVAIVSNMQSYLAQHADYVINATIEAEACPNNLAPTTSTTAHLAIGDAIAVALLSLRNFTPQDFAKYHPGGSLGKQLYLKVDDLIGRHQTPCVSEDALIADVILEISSKRLGATAVVGEGQKLLGLITDGDLRRMLQKQLDIRQTRAKDIMTRNPKTIERSAYAVRALQLMQDNNISQAVVTEGDKVIGFIHLHDLLQEGIV